MVGSALRDCHDFDQTKLKGTCRAEIWGEGLHEEDGKGAGQEGHTSLSSEGHFCRVHLYYCEYMVTFLSTPLSYEMRTKNNKNKKS